MGKLVSALLLIPITLACPSELLKRDTCTACNPSGQKTLIPPPVGPGIDSLYTDLVQSVQGINWKRSEPVLYRRADPPICCATGTNCVLLQGFGIAMCYDKFTTDFILPDGSYGNINNGTYHAISGQIVNLINGNVSDGSPNIYAGDSAAVPNTSTMSIPPVYTAAGVGGPIPIASLAEGYLLITTIIGPTTIPAITIDGTTMGTVTIDGTVIPATTILGTTYAATTISAGEIATITETVNPSGMGSGGKKSEASRVLVFGFWLLSACLMFGVALL